MEMTTEEHIEVLNSYNHGFTGYAGNLQDSIYVAVDTMRKYQKIQEIINNTDCIGEDVIRYKMVCEVVKGGN